MGGGGELFKTKIITNEQEIRKEDLQLEKSKSEYNGNPKPYRLILIAPCHPLTLNSKGKQELTNPNSTT